MFLRKVLSLVCASLSLSLAITDAVAAEVPVYKCTQPNGTVLYTDHRCKGGTALDIRLGPVDPTAPARLAHAQAELDAAAAKRRAEEQMAAARREEMNREAELAQEGTAPFADDPDYSDYPYWDNGLVDGPFHRHAHRRGSHSRKHEHAHHHQGRVPVMARSSHGAR